MKLPFALIFIFLAHFPNFGEAAEFHCARQHGYWNIFKADGKAINPKAFYYTESTCMIAVTNASAGVVCAPFRGGSALVDSHKSNNIMIGSGKGDPIYSTIEQCAWASRSARASDDYVCGLSIYGDTRIFNRRDLQDTAFVGDNSFSTPQDCYQFLRGN